MTKNLDEDGFRSIVHNYDLFYIDLWGVIHNGINLYDNAILTLKEISKLKKDYILLTNAPRPNKTVHEFLKKIEDLEKALEQEVKTKKAEMSRLELEKIYAIQKIRNALKIKWKRTKDSLLNLKKDQLDTTTRLSLLENHKLKRELEF